MPTVPARLKSTLAIVLAGLVAVPATAQATLAFVRKPLKPVVFAAADDGSRQRRIAPGTEPRVSPDGQTIAYLHTRGGTAYRPELMVVPADGSAPPRRLLADWSQADVFDWSSDSSTIAAVRGPEPGRKRLVLIDVSSGAQRTIARGYFAGVSFAPESGQQGGQLVYARAGRERFPLRADVFRLDLLPPGSESAAFDALALRPELPDRITRDHRSLYPLWGPNGRIVYAKQLGAERRRYGPKNELFLMDPGGGRVRRLTHTRVDPLLLGLVPTDWSADGRRLLAEFQGQDTSYAVTVDPRTGAQHPLTRDYERGLVGSALSANGRRVLGYTGGFEPGPDHDVVEVPYGGGKPRVLARNAFQPDWSR